jgi:plasmid stabilization system protein ParE
VRRAVFLASVEADLLEIYTWLAETSDSLSVADHFVQRLRMQCHHLAGLPGLMGRARPELGEDLRSFPFGAYVIFFRYNNERFEVIDILHGSRDIDALF